MGGLVGDVLGAVVESESPTYIAKHYRHLGELVAKDWVPDILGRRWRVGRYTDDTQMTLFTVEAIVRDTEFVSLIAIAVCSITFPARIASR